MISEDYNARALLHQRARDAIDVRTRRIGWARLLLFALLAAGAYELTTSAAHRTSIAAAEAVGAAIFLALVAWHARLRDQSRLAESRRRACEVGAARVDRRWDAIPPAAWTESRAQPQQAVELHVIGPQSLARLLPPTSAIAGQPTIWRWLTAAEPPALDELRHRQTAVRELVPLADWRERLSILASRMRGNGSSFDGFRHWGATAAESAAGTPWTARLLAAATIAALAAAVSGTLPSAVVTVLLFVNLALAQRARRRLDAVLAEIATGDHRVLGLSALVAEAGAPEFASPGLATLRRRMGAPSSALALRALERIATFGDLRFSPMAHVIAQATTIWDAHVLYALEAWRRQHGPDVAEWLSALGEIEAHAALATLAYDNPAWTFPELEPPDGDGTLEATGLGHPILPLEARVANDVGIGPPGTVLLVTGPNMAGKSTLLRAVGLNVVIAQAGGPVCAARMRMPRVRLRTSIHAHDALEDGISLFMAELLRVKGIVEDARDGAGTPVLYVVDEMLRGTNTEERHVAVTTVLRHLIAAGAIGLVSTHDVALAREPSLDAHLRTVHFGAQFVGSGAGARVAFDYRLHPGPATGRNALRLLDMMGLGPGAAT